nr:hypothetical protein Iba_chr06cCG11020 [Ipomoea batatas]
MDYKTSCTLYLYNATFFKYIPNQIPKPSTPSPQIRCEEIARSNGENQKRISENRRCVFLSVVHGYNLQVRGREWEKRRRLMAYARSNSSDVSCGICGSVGGGTDGTGRKLVTRALDLDDFPGW